jgi:putative aminopeptidase FrvX
MSFLRRLSLPLSLLGFAPIFTPISRAQDPTVHLLQTLSEAPGPSGYEEPIRKIMVQRMTPLADHLSYDALGSIIATQGSSGPRVMIDAHMDELGGLVRRITPDGFLSIQTLGYWLDEALVGQRWIILGSKGPVHAASVIRDAHLINPDEQGKLLDTHDNFFLDIGAGNSDQVRELGVSVGDPVVPDSTFTVLNGTQNYMGKAFDDRIGCAIIIDVMTRLAHAAHPNQLFYSITVQEETLLSGARASAELIKPEVAIVLEGGVTSDVPGTRTDSSQETLGSGPAVFLYNPTEMPNHKLLALARQIAADKSIPLQQEVVVGYGDDSSEIQKSNGGVPTITLTVPIRYTHAHNGIMNRSDYDRSVQLLLALIQKLDSQTVHQLRDFAPSP